MLSYLLLGSAVLANAMLGGFVLANNSKANLNRIFSAFSFAMGGWCTVSFLEDTGLSHAIVNLLVRLDFILSTFMLVLFLAFCFDIVRSKSRNLALIGWIGAVVMVILTITNRIVLVSFRNGEVKFDEQGAYPLFVAFALYCLGFGLGLLVRRHHFARGRERTQIQFIFLGLGLTAFAIMLTNVLLPNITNTSPDVTRLGIYSTLFLTGFMAYAIIKHRLMNIRMIVARSVAYTLLLLSLAGTYVLVVFSVSKIFFPQATSSVAQTAFYAVLAVVISFTFQPLKRFFERFTDRIFFRDNYDSQEFLNDFGGILVNEFQLDHLLQKSLTKICTQLKIASGQFYIFSHQRVYKVEHFGPIPKRLITAPHLQALRHRVIVSDELTGGKEKEIMEAFGFRVVMHLRTHEEFVGYMLLGDKLSGNIYSSQDIEVLKILTQELAVAISNSKAYEEIAQFNLTLQQKIDEATKQLQSANRHLKDLDKAKDDFISVVSHQLRTPLSGINNYLSMVLEGETGKINKQQQEFLGHAYVGSRRMVAMISDLLNISRMSAGRFKIEPGPVDLLAMVEEEVGQLQQSAQEKGVKLRFDAPKQKLPTMQLDEDKTRQVVMNFIDNAIYYTPKGEIAVSLGEVNGKAELRVKDNGIGVPKSAQRHLFTKFYRADNAKGVRPNGTGLGLYLAKRVVEDQGGSIIFESIEGKGSTFGFALPIKRAAKPAPKAAHSGAPVGVKPAKKVAHAGRT